MMKNLRLMASLTGTGFLSIVTLTVLAGQINDNSFFWLAAATACFMLAAISETE